ncbi:MAG: inorganic diphosphatase [Planctomycetota bacterium]
MPLPNRFMQVPPGPDAGLVPKVVNVIVEIPKGRRSKFEIDKVTGLVKLDRYLYSSAVYPGEYGIIPRTHAEDGDPLDALVMVNEPTFPGCLIEARPIGLFKMTDQGDNDFKILCVPNTDPMFDDYESLWRVPKHYLREVENFFATYKALEHDNNVETQGWADVEYAHQEILECIERYDKKDRSMQSRISWRAYSTSAQPCVSTLLSCSMAL